MQRRTKLLLRLLTSDRSKRAKVHTDLGLNLRTIYFGQFEGHNTNYFLSTWAQSRLCPSKTLDAYQKFEVQKLCTEKLVEIRFYKNFARLSKSFARMLKTLHDQEIEVVQSF